MAKQTIFLGTIPNDNTGTDLRSGGNIINDNFTELYTTYRNEATSITLTAADIKSVIRYTGATDITVTIPENTILLESEIVIRQSGAGIITLVAEGGVVLNTSGGLNTNGQHTEIFLNNPIEQNIFDMLGGVE
jgi:hypothetical protein